MGIQCTESPRSEIWCCYLNADLDQEVLIEILIYESERFQGN